MTGFLFFILILIAFFSFYRSHLHIYKPVEVHLVSSINNQTVIKGCLLQKLFGEVVIKVNDIDCKNDKKDEILAIPKHNIFYMKVLEIKK